MLPLTTAPSSQSFTTCPSEALAVPGWESITASGGSVHTRTHAAFCITPRGSTWASATHPTTVTRCCGQWWSGHNRANRSPGEEYAGGVVYECRDGSWVFMYPSAERVLRRPAPHFGPSTTSP